MMPFVIDNSTVIDGLHVVMYSEVDNNEVNGVALDVSQEVDIYVE